MIPAGVGSGDLRDGYPGGYNVLFDSKFRNVGTKVWKFPDLERAQAFYDEHQAYKKKVDEDTARVMAKRKEEAKAKKEAEQAPAKAAAAAAKAAAKAEAKAKKDAEKAAAKEAAKAAKAAAKAAK